jgi:hypothetical protein
MLISNSRRLAIALACCVVARAASAQSPVRERLTADDIGGVMVTVFVRANDPVLDDASQTLLANRMGSILSAGGLSGVGVVTPFIIFPRVAVIESTRAEGGLEAVTSASVEVSFVVRHLQSRSTIHQWTGTFTGAGKDQTAAVRNAIARLRPGDDELAQFATETRRRIVTYYESNCDAIRSQARALARAGDLDDAYAQLLAVPGEASACQRAAAADAEKIAAAAESAFCDRQLRLARAAKADRRFREAADLAAAVPVGGACAKAADAIIADVERQSAATFRTAITLIRETRQAMLASSSNMNSSDAERMRGRSRAAAFFNRAESRTIRLDLLR